MTATHEDRILRSLRSITRAIDVNSRQLTRSIRLTTPQLVCLRTVANAGEMTPSQIARSVALSQATVTGILDRLERRGLVSRRRSTDDRRRVFITLTEEGARICASAPSAIHELFAKRLRAVDEEERAAIAASLERVAEMMAIPAAAAPSPAPPE